MPIATIGSGAMWFQPRLFQRFFMAMGFLYLSRNFIACFVSY